LLNTNLRTFPKYKIDYGIIRDHNEIDLEINE